jgi:gamma-glutamyltranspeptidase
LKAARDRFYKGDIAPWTMGSLAAIVVDPTTGVLSAGPDPRVDAHAITW